MNNIYNIANKEFDNEEINITFLFNVLRRNKKLIILTSLVFLIFSSAFTFLIRKKTWEGRFEIVLKSTELEKKLNPFSSLGLGINDATSPLQTEVGILKSPSVLLPVFDFVNNEYKSNYPNKKELFFSDWRKMNLSILLQPNTSILEILYSDQNKEIIIPVLERISNAYKDYSGKNRRRNIQLAKDYLIEQVAIFKVKSANSLKAAQQYAINQDLITVNNQNIESSSFGEIEKNKEQQLKFRPSFILSNTGIEEIRARAANEIRNIDIQVNKIEGLGDNFKELQYLGSTIPGLRNTGLPQKLENLETELVERRTKYTDNDIKITGLLDDRKILINLLKERAIGYLKAERIQQEALMESATRPKKVILNYKELMREAGRDENTLISLENNLREIKLQEAKLEDPWELINQPTLEQSPKGLSDKKYIFVLTSIGFLIGCIISFIKDNKSGILYEDELISKEFNTEIIDKININTEKFKYYNFDILSKEIFKDTESCKLSFIVSGNIDQLTFKKLKSLFNQIKNFKIEENFSEINSKNKIIAFAINGEIKKQQIYQTLNRLGIQNKKLDGLILLEK